VRRDNRYYKEGIKNPKKLPTLQLKSICHESAVKPKNIKRSLPYLHRFKRKKKILELFYLKSAFI
jgi:hypothetical protein